MSIDNAALHSKYKNIWDVLNALMEQDAYLSDTIHKHYGCEDEIVLDRFIHYDALPGIDNLINVHLIKNLAHQWDYMYIQLCEHVTKYSTCIPIKADYPRLYDWVIDQRGRRSVLTPARIAQLDAIGFEWPESMDSRWDSMYEQLCAYKERYGNIIVPTRNPEFMKLSNWMEHNRRKMREKKALTPTQFEKLQALGVGVVWKKTLDEEKWQVKYQQLLAYKEQHANLFIPQRDLTLGKWCHRQRHLYKRDKLPINRKEQLDAIGFNFHAADEMWAMKIQENKAWIDGGKPKITTKLRHWRQSVRRSYRKGTLSDDKIQDILATDASLLR